MIIVNRFERTLIASKLFFCHKFAQNYFCDNKKVNEDSNNSSKTLIEHNNTYIDINVEISNDIHVHIDTNINVGIDINVDNEIDANIDNNLNLNTNSEEKKKFY